MLVCRVEGHSVSSLFALIPRGCHLQYLGFCSLLQHHVACRLVGATLKTSCVQCVCDVEFPMLMFGVTMSGDTWEQVCVLQKRRLHEVNVKFIFFYDEAMSPVRAYVRILQSKEVFWETCASWGGVAPGLARRRCSNGDLS